MLDLALVKKIKIKEWVNIWITSVQKHLKKAILSELVRNSLVKCVHDTCINENVIWKIFHTSCNPDSLEIQPRGRFLTWAGSGQLIFSLSSAHKGLVANWSSKNPGFHTWSLKCSTTCLFELHCRAPTAFRIWINKRMNLASTVIASQQPELVGYHHLWIEILVARSH